MLKEEEKVKGLENWNGRGLKLVSDWVGLTVKRDREKWLRGKERRKERE